MVSGPARHRDRSGSDELCMERTERSSAVYSLSSEKRTKSGVGGRVWVGRWGSRSARDTHDTYADPTGGGRVVAVAVVVVVGGA